MTKKDKSLTHFIIFFIIPVISLIILFSMFQYFENREVHESVENNKTIICKVTKYKSISINKYKKLNQDSIITSDKEIFNLRNCWLEK
jgi:hypothetical protein